MRESAAEDMKDGAGCGLIESCCFRLDHRGLCSRSQSHVPVLFLCLVRGLVFLTVEIGCQVSMMLLVEVVAAEEIGSRSF